MKITIKALTGAKLDFNVEETTTVDEVKAMIQEKEGINKDQIRLIFSGKQMADAATMSASGIAPGSVLNMVLELR